MQWAHPKFGPLLASASYDGRAIVWKEVQQGQWVKVFETARPEASSQHTHHNTQQASTAGRRARAGTSLTATVHLSLLVLLSRVLSVNSISFAPHSFGLILACACSDGTVTVCTRRETDGRWEQQTFVAHKGGVNSISWGPDVKTGALLAAAHAVPAMKAERRFVTGGCDNRIRIWRQSDADGSWEDQPVFTNSDASHGDWVRDVCLGALAGPARQHHRVGQRGQDVALWYEEASGEWRRGQVLTFDSGVWRVSWSVNGNVLAVSQGDQKVSLWKETADGQWKQVSTEQQQQQQQQQVQD